MDIFPPSQTAEEIARDERYAAMKRAIDAEYDARMLYEMQTQTAMSLERYLLRDSFRDANSIITKFPDTGGGFFPV